MTDQNYDLHAMRQQVEERAASRPIGSASRFALMNAADAVSRAIEAEAREAETGKAA